MTEALLTALTGRLAEVEAERERTSQELHRLEAEAAALSEESVHLRALIDRHQAQQSLASASEAPLIDSRDGVAEPVADSLSASVAGQTPGEPSSNRWLLVATEVLTKADGPVHYRELYKRMKTLGSPSFGGQNPVATFLSAMSREAARPGSPVRRAGRGEYELTVGDPEPTSKRSKNAAGSAA